MKKNRYPTWIPVFLHMGLPVTGKPMLLLTGDAGAESIETDIYILITSVNLVNITDDARTLGRHSCNQESDSGTDIR